MDDAPLIAAVRAGDYEAFTELVRAYETRIRQLCRSYLADSAEADDAAQDVFVKAFTSLEQYRQDLSFLAWLCRIATNHCLDILRKRSRRKTESLDAYIGEKGDRWEALLPQEAAAVSSRIEDVHLAQKALNEIPLDYREVLILRELNELSYEEIAATLGCSLDAVKARLKRARAALQEKARHLFPAGTFSEKEPLK